MGRGEYIANTTSSWEEYLFSLTVFRPENSRHFEENAKKSIGNVKKRPEKVRILREMAIRQYEKSLNVSTSTYFDSMSGHTVMNALLMGPFLKEMIILIGEIPQNGFSESDFMKIYNNLEYILINDRKYVPRAKIEFVPFPSIENIEPLKEVAKKVGIKSPFVWYSNGKVRRGTEPTGLPVYPNGILAHAIVVSLVLLANYPLKGEKLEKIFGDLSQLLKKLRNSSISICPGCTGGILTTYQNSTIRKIIEYLVGSPKVWETIRRYASRDIRTFASSLEKMEKVNLYIFPEWYGYRLGSTFYNKGEGIEKLLENKFGIEVTPSDNTNLLCYPSNQAFRKGYGLLKYKFEVKLL